MADTVYETKDITLHNGTKLKVKPASIKTMRAFNKALNNGADYDVDRADPKYDSNAAEDSAIDWLISLAIILTEKENDVNKVILEEHATMDIVYDIIHAGAGVRLNDPKLIEAAENLLV